MANKQNNSDKPEVNTLSPATNANTLEQMPDAHTESAPTRNLVRTVREWKILKKTKEYMYAATLAKMGWREGKEVSEADYMKALASLRGIK